MESDLLIYVEIFKMVNSLILSGNRAYLVN